ncbi:MAG TPA: hypothetical protein PKV66_02795 [Candidatus Pelethenecus sp.]|nr:hypothetical protein [Candidatus Pelethenecus sp.]
MKLVGKRFVKKNLKLKSLKIKVERRSGVLKDFDDNLFVLVDFDPIGYSIYCVDSGDFTELSPFAESPYKDCNLTSNSQKYIFMCGYYDKNFSTGNCLIRVLMFIKHILLIH